MTFTLVAPGQRFMEFGRHACLDYDVRVRRLSGGDEETEGSAASVFSRVDYLLAAAAVGDYDLYYWSR